MKLLNWVANRRLRAFERRWNYDAAYAHAIVDEAGAAAAMPLAALQKLGSYKKIPLNAYYGATLTAGKQADCGPCLQLAVAMAEHDGVAPEVIRAILGGGELPDDARLGVELARSTIARDLRAEPAREEILRRWGRRGLVSLAYGIVAAQAYPAFKYAMGYGHACARVRVAGQDLPLQTAVAR